MVIYKNFDYILESHQKTEEEIQKTKTLQNVFEQVT